MKRTEGERRLALRHIGCSERQGRPGGEEANGAGVRRGEGIGHLFGAFHMPPAAGGKRPSTTHRAKGLARCRPAGRPRHAGSGASRARHAQGVCFGRPCPISSGQAQIRRRWQVLREVELAGRQRCGDVEGGADGLDRLLHAFHRQRAEAAGHHLGRADELRNSPAAAPAPAPPGRVGSRRTRAAIAWSGSQQRSWWPRMMARIVPVTTRGLASA